MTMTLRRLMLGIGAALLVGGWGTTQFAHELLQTYEGSARQIAWRVKVYEGWGGPGRVIYGVGVISMAVGAGLIGFAVLRPTNHKNE